LIQYFPRLLSLSRLPYFFGTWNKKKDAFRRRHTKTELKTWKEEAKEESGSGTDLMSDKKNHLIAAAASI
jgi:hypothetical protein